MRCLPAARSFLLRRRGRLARVALQAALDHWPTTSHCTQQQPGQPPVQQPAEGAMGAPQERRTAEQRAILEHAATKGSTWLKRILDVENHTDQELAWSLTDSPLKVPACWGCCGCQGACLLGGGEGGGTRTPKLRVPPEFGGRRRHLPRRGRAACAALRDTCPSLPQRPLLLRHDCCLVQPFWVAQAQAIMFYRVTKTAALLGRATGHGFLVTR